MPLAPDVQRQLDEAARRDEMSIDVFRAKIAECTALSAPATVITTEFGAWLLSEIQRLQAALLAEREACAAVAESFIPSGFRGGDHILGDAFGIARDDRARTIANAIRTRGAINERSASPCLR